MKTKASTFALQAILASSAFLISEAAMGQPVQSPAPAGGTGQPSAAPSPTRPPTSSNPWETLPVMSADRCLAEAIGTASDPKTGAPVRASVDPETGKPLCPSTQPTTETQPPR